MNENQTATKPPIAIGIFYTAMFIISVAFLVLLPNQTDLAPERQGWWTQPAFMPGLSLGLIALTAMILFFQHWINVYRDQALRHDRATILRELFQWIKPAEYFIYYSIYIWLLGMVGYFLSSLIFIAGLCLRVGLRSKKWMFIALLTAFGLIALFRWGLQVWIPPAELYELFPKNIRTFLIRKF